jgi:hypothetical protein
MRHMAVTSLLVAAALGPALYFEAPGWVIWVIGGLGMLNSIYIWTSAIHTERRRRIPAVAIVAAEDVEVGDSRLLRWPAVTAALGTLALSVVGGLIVLAIDRLSD